MFVCVSNVEVCMPAMRYLFFGFKLARSVMALVKRGSDAAVVEKESFIYRAAVLFKSASQSAIFTVERGVLNLPGGRLHDHETYVAAAVRVVKEELGGWPSQVTQNLERHPAVNCGITKYYVMTLNEEVFKSTFSYFWSVIEGRAQKERHKITALKVASIDKVCGDKRNEVSREVEELFEVMGDRGIMEVTACSGQEAAPRQTFEYSSLSSTDRAPPALASSPSAEVAPISPGSSSAAPAPAWESHQDLDNHGNQRPPQGRGVPWNGGAAGRNPSALENAPLAATGTTGPAWPQRGLPRPPRAYTCGSCKTSFNSLRKCWECAAWSCTDCSFWCTLCPKGRGKYTVCRACYDTRRYLYQSAPKTWQCWNCWS